MQEPELLEETQTRRPLVLIVEDEPAIAELFKTLFRMEGMAATIALNNTEAMGAMESERPDLILLDVMMPFESGLDLCRFVRSTPKYADIPVVIVSAGAQDNDMEAGYEAGANAYLKKPVPNAELLQVVREHIQTGSRSLHDTQSISDIETAVRSATVEVKRYLAEINRAHASYDAYSRRLQESLGLSAEEKQKLARRAADLYREIIRDNETAGWEILYAILKRVEAREAAIRARGSHHPVGSEEWQIAAARSSFVAEDCRSWATTLPDQISEEYVRAIEQGDRVYAYLLERHGQRTLEEEGKFEALSNFRSMIIQANGPGNELDQINEFYDLLNPLRARLSSIQLPDAVLMVEGSGHAGNGADPTASKVRSQAEPRSERKASPTGLP